MAAIDVDRQIAALSQKLNQDITLRSGKTVRLTSVRRSGADGSTLILTGTITFNGVPFVYEAPNFIEWRNCKSGGSAAEIAESARLMLDGLVT